MCGNVGIYHKDGMSPTRVALFEQMLWVDSLRGYHSTGVIGCTPEGNNFVTVKEAVDGAYFTQTQVWADFKKANEKSKFLVGHNRWATQGKINKRNSHPFNHGHISGVHNGTLYTQVGLPDHHKFEVDSENIIYSIAQKGLEWTASRLDGAFALVWYDTRTKDLNFIRNDERPLHIFTLTDGTILWASEAGMLEWLVNRSSRVPAIATREKLKEGVWKRIHLSGTVTEKVVDIQETFSAGGWGNWGHFHQKKKEKKSGNVHTLATSPWKKGDKIKVFMDTFIPYTANNLTGTVTCFNHQSLADDRIQIVIVSQAPDDFYKGKEVQAEVTYTYLFDNETKIKIVLTNPKEVIKVAGKKEVLATACGLEISREELGTKYERTCYTCGQDIQFEELQEAYLVNNHNLMCGECSNEFKGDV